MLIDTVQRALKEPWWLFCKELHSAFVKQGNVFSQLSFFLILGMLPSTYFSSHAIHTNGCSKSKSEALSGLRDLS